MKRVDRKQLLRILAPLGLLLLSACQPNQAVPRGQADMTSVIPRGPVPPPNGGFDFSREPQLGCSGFTVGGVTGKLKTYYEGGYPDPSAYDANRVRLMFDVEPAEWSASDGTYMEFFRWRVLDQSDTSQLDPTPLSFYIEPALHLAQVGPTFGNRKFTRAELVSLSGESSPDLKNFNVVVTGVDLPYQVLRVVFRSGGSAPSTIAEADFLIPAFLANPAAYKASKPLSPTLYTLHPFHDKLSLGWNSAQFAQEAQKFCF